MKKAYRQKNRGFALLFSVLLASFLLTIGLSIFSIALKELAISTAARQSVKAFFAADSGRECAIYWDIKQGQIPSLISGIDGGEIKCGDYSGTISGAGDSTSGPITSTIPNDIPSDQVVKITSDAVSPNYYVEISKTLSGGDIFTTIISRGYDSISDDRVERAIRQTY